MPDKHVNELPSILPIDITPDKLLIIGDPDTGTLYKTPVGNMPNSGTINNIISQTYIRSVAANDVVIVANITWNNIINNQPIKVELSGFWLAVSATTNYTLHTDINFGANGFGFNGIINSGTAQEGAFKFTFSFNPSAVVNSFGSFEFVFSRDDSFSGFPEMQTNQLNTSNYLTMANLGAFQEIGITTPVGLSVQNATVIITIADPSL